ncbi:MAG: Hpt domain-containing protein [Bacteroidota bacterium]|nr:Hpt domain-containing protein [Bacteroidota bacterium]
MQNPENNKGITEKQHSYDLTELIQLSNGSNAFVANMIEIFIRSSTEALTKIKEALIQTDWEEVSALAHKAAPSFHFMGLIIFSDKLRSIEINALKEKEHKSIAEMIGLIDKNMVVILADLKAELAKFK